MSKQREILEELVNAISEEYDKCYSKSYEDVLDARMELGCLVEMNYSLIMDLLERELGRILEEDIGR